MSCRISSSDSGERSVTISTRVAVVERPREIAQLAVDLHGQRGAREARADRGGEVGAGGAVVEVLAGAVGQLDLHRGGMLAACAARPSAPRTARELAGGFEPERRATAIDAVFSTATRATTRRAPSVPNASACSARAPSVA